MTAAKKKQRIKIDMSEWNLGGDWQEKLSDQIKIETNAYGIDIELDLATALEEMTRQIAGEIIEAFLNGEIYFTVTKDGLELEAQEIGTQKFVIPLGEIGIKFDAFDAMRHWMKEELALFGGAEDKEGQAIYAAEYAKQGLPPPVFDEHGNIKKEE